MTSNMAPVVEVAGDGVPFVAPYNEEEIRTALERLLHSHVLSQRLRGQGWHNAKRFDPRIIAEIYADAYRRICKSYEITL